MDDYGGGVNWSGREDMNPVLGRYGIIRELGRVIEAELLDPLAATSVTTFVT